jgi:hydrogenase maturation protease
VGNRVAQALQERGLSLPHGLGQEVTVAETNAAGLNLLDLLVGYDRAIIVDAIQTQGGQPGQVYRLSLDDLPFTLHTASTHDTNLATALELGRRLGMAVPREVVIFAIEVADVTTFSEQCTPEVEQSIPKVVDMVIEEVGGR